MRVVSNRLWDTLKESNKLESMWTNVIWIRESSSSNSIYIFWGCL